MAIRAATLSMATIALCSPGSRLTMTDLPCRPSRLPASSSSGSAVTRKPTFAASNRSSARRPTRRLVCTTECFLDGYAIADKSIPLEDYRNLGEPIPSGKYFQRLAARPARLKIHLIAGMLEADGDERF